PPRTCGSESVLWIGAYVKFRVYRAFVDTRIAANPGALRGTETVPSVTFASTGKRDTALGFSQLLASLVSCPLIPSARITLLIVRSLNLTVTVAESSILRLTMKKLASPLCGSKLADASIAGASPRAPAL